MVPSTFREFLFPVLSPFPFKTFLSPSKVVHINSPGLSPYLPSNKKWLISIGSWLKLGRKVIKFNDKIRNSNVCGIYIGSTYPLFCLLPSAFQFYHSPFIVSFPCRHAMQMQVLTTPTTYATSPRSRPNGVLVGRRRLNILNIGRWAMVDTQPPISNLT